MRPRWPDRLTVRLVSRAPQQGCAEAGDALGGFAKDDERLRLPPQPEFGDAG
jgi:hypothetical protein